MLKCLAGGISGNLHSPLGFRTERNPQVKLGEHEFHFLLFSLRVNTCTMCKVLNGFSDSVLT